MITKIQTKFDVGDIALYKVQRWGKNYGQSIPVEITRVDWFLSKDGVRIRYDCETLARSSVSKLFADDRFINCGFETEEKYFSEYEGHISHPINIEFDTKYEFDQVVLQYPNNDIYGMFPPRPYRIVKFVYHKIMQKWTNKEPTITESYAIRGYEVYEEKWCDAQCSLDRNYDTIIDKLPDDYLSKCWKGVHKGMIWSNEGEPMTDHEKLFKYYGIMEEAKQAFNDYHANKLRPKKKNPTKSKNKSKVDELLAGLSEKEKKELLKKLSK